MADTKMNVRGEALADVVEASLRRQCVPYQREALPLDDFRFTVDRQDRSCLETARGEARQAARLQKNISNEADNG